MKRNFFAIFLFFSSILFIEPGFAEYTKKFKNDLMLTPFGVRPKQCVHTHPSGTTIRETKNGVEAIAPDGKVRFFPALNKCIAFNNTWKTKRANSRNQHRLLGESNMNLASNRWLDNAWWFPPRPISMMSGNYTVPNNPAVGRLNYWLYYFLGIENTNDNVELTILQPVLAWSRTGWTFASWNCCPSGQVHNSRPVVVAAKSNITGKIEKQGGAWVIDSIAGSQHSTLRVNSMNRVFDYADATLETYYVNGCNYYPTEPILYNNISLKLTDGSIASPRWSKTNNTECNGKVTIYNPAMISIKHN